MNQICTGKYLIRCCKTRVFRLFFLTIDVGYTGQRNPFAVFFFQTFFLTLEIEL